MAPLLDWEDLMADRIMEVLIVDQFHPRNRQVKLRQLLKDVEQTTGISGLWSEEVRWLRRIKTPC